MITIPGSDIPSGNEVKWYYGGAEATLIQEDLVESSGLITLSKKAAFGCVLTRTTDGSMTSMMVELQADGVTTATEASGTNKVRTASAGATTVTAYYVDIETTSLSQIMACKDASSNLSVDTASLNIQGQAQTLRKASGTARTVSLEELDYTDALMGALFGDRVSNSPASGNTKWVDNFRGTRKISALIGKQIEDSILVKKWFLLGCHVSKLDTPFPNADYYTRSMDFIADYMVVTRLPSKSYSIIPSYDDATLSGVPVIIRFKDPDTGIYYYTKAYPTTSATANITGDAAISGVHGINDATLSGAPKTFGIMSGDIFYRTKAYPTISADITHSAGTTFMPTAYDNADLFGMPRVAVMGIGGSDYHIKIYPNTL